jgi:hypothetical protein
MAAGLAAVNGHPTLVRQNNAGDDMEERAFARPIWPYDSDLVAAIQCQ